MAVKHRLVPLLVRVAFALALLLLLVGGPFMFVRLRSPKLPPDRAAPRAEYPLQISLDHRYLIDQKGVPFLVRGEAAWSLLVQLRRDEVEHYLEDRRRRGFNLLIVNLIEHCYADHAPRNAYGQGPFTVEGDFATPNEKYFAHVDWVLARAAAKGFAVLLCPAYLGFDGGFEGWFAEMAQNGPEKLRAYGRYVGRRYARFDNILWLQGGDFTPPADDLVLVDAVAEGIRSGDTRHLNAAHWSPETSGADVEVAGWLDVNTTYTYLPPHLKVLEDYRRPDRMPLFFVEGTYEDEHDATTQSLRAQAYQALLSGASGEVSGNHFMWTFKPSTFLRRLSGRTWTAALDSPATLSMQHLHELWASIAWTSLEPDDRYEVLTWGQGTKGTLEYALLARSPDGRLAVAYVPSVREIELDLSKLARPLRGRWFDPTSAREFEIDAAALATRGRVRLRPPGPNAAGDSDWVLLVEAPPDPS